MNKAVFILILSLSTYLGAYSQTFTFHYADWLQYENGEEPENLVLRPFVTCDIDISRQVDGKYTFQLTDLYLQFSDENERHYMGTLILQNLEDMKFSDDYITLVAERDSARYSPSLSTGEIGAGYYTPHHISLLAQFNEDHIKFRIIGDYTEIVGGSFHPQLSTDTFPVYHIGDINKDGYVNALDVSELYDIIINGNQNE
ncbi:MAG: hypothetical protein IJ835_02945 [Muribaculaceae bacterium]|nr:hypothetical protein [Muribaculaceae bacterium]